MITAKDEKEALVQQLLAAKEKGQALELQLLVKGSAKEAGKIEKANRELTVRIRTLLAAMMRDWIGDAEELHARLTTANSELRRNIVSVTQGIETAKNVVDFIRQIDGMVALAAKLLAAA